MATSRHSATYPKSGSHLENKSFMPVLGSIAALFVLAFTVVFLIVAPSNYQDESKAYTGEITVISKTIHQKDCVLSYFRDGDTAKELRVSDHRDLSCHIIQEGKALMKDGLLLRNVD